MVVYDSSVVFPYVLCRAQVGGYPGPIINNEQALLSTLGINGQLLILEVGEAVNSGNIVIRFSVDSFTTVHTISVDKRSTIAEWYIFHSSLFVFPLISFYLQQVQYAQTNRRKYPTPEH